MYACARTFWDLAESQWLGYVYYLYGNLMRKVKCCRIYFCMTDTELSLSTTDQMLQCVDDKLPCSKRDAVLQTDSGHVRVLPIYKTLALSLPALCWGRAGLTKCSLI